MTKAVAVKSAAPRARTVNGATVPLDTIGSAGAYICNWSGHLLRVPESSIGGSRPLGLNIVGREPLLVTKISENPRVPLSEARSLAAAFGVGASF